jgi:hypothetical protein
VPPALRVSSLPVHTMQHQQGARQWGVMENTELGPAMDVTHLVCCRTYFSFNITYHHSNINCMLIFSSQIFKLIFI